VLAALPVSVAPTDGAAARAGGSAVATGDGAAVAVRTSPVPVALTALGRMGTAVGAARDQLRCR
jgi:hypothetical protein